MNGNNIVTHDSEHSMDFIYQTHDLVVALWAAGWDIVVTMDRTLLAGCIAAAVIVAIVCVASLGPVPKLLRFYAFVFMAAFVFVGAVTLVELGPVFFDPAELARGQVTPESN